MPALAAELGAALADELPLLKRDGGFVRAGYDAALDEARALRDESRRVIAALQARYAEETGVRSLKIRHNNVLGYFVEVTAQHGEQAARRRRSTRPSSTARRWPAQCASPPPSWASWKPRSPAPPTARSASSSTSSSGWPAR